MVEEKTKRTATIFAINFVVLSLFYGLSLLKTYQSISHNLLSYFFITFTFTFISTYAMSLINGEKKIE